MVWSRKNYDKGYLKFNWNGYIFWSLNWYILEVKKISSHADKTASCHLLLRGSFQISDEHPVLFIQETQALGLLYRVLGPRRPMFRIFFPRSWSQALHIFIISIYTLSDLGVLSNLIGSLSLANEHYSPPTEWTMRKPNKNKMAGVNSRFASVSESIFNGFLLKMLLRSLSVYILKQLFFSISVNSGRIFTSISKNNC